MREVVKRPPVRVAGLSYPERLEEAGVRKLAEHHVGVKVVAGLVRVRLDTPTMTAAAESKAKPFRDLLKLHVLHGRHILRAIGSVRINDERCEIAENRLT